MARPSGAPDPHARLLAVFLVAGSAEQCTRRSTSNRRRRSRARARDRRHRREREGAGRGGRARPSHPSCRAPTRRSAASSSLPDEGDRRRTRADAEGRGGKRARGDDRRRRRLPVRTVTPGPGWELAGLREPFAPIAMAMELAPSEDRDLGTLWLEVPVAMTAVVIDLEGKPLKGAEVDAFAVSRAGTVVTESRRRRTGGGTSGRGSSASSPSRRTRSRRRPQSATPTARR